MDDDFDKWLSERDASEQEDDGRLLPGTVVGSCRIVAYLGHGGFADVYRACDAHGVAVAIKILHKLDDKSRARFERESEILSRIRHTNIPRLLGFGSCGNRPYMVMELLRGYELPKGDRKVAAFLKQVISAAEELHRHGYVHRDIKPTNILAREDGTPVLIDVGLACPMSAVERERAALSVEEGKAVVVGTAGYAAPEQFDGRGVGPQADVHAIGMLINSCFDGKMPSCWDRIYRKATVSNPKSRYQTMAALRRAIVRRNWRRVLLAALCMAVAALVVLLCVNAIKEVPRVESRTPPTLGGVVSASPLLIDLMPTNAPNADATYSVRCVIEYKDNKHLRSKPGPEHEQMRTTGDLLNKWLKELVEGKYVGAELSELVSVFGDESFEDDLRSDFEMCVGEKIDELNLDDSIDVEIVAVRVYAEDEFEDELAEFWRRQFFEQQD